MTDQTRAERISELEKRCEKATAGPWSCGPNTLAGKVWVYQEGAARSEPLFEPRGFYNACCDRWHILKARFDSFHLRPYSEETEAEQHHRWNLQAECNASFVASAREDIPWLLAELKKADEEIGVVTAAHFKIAQALCDERRLLTEANRKLALLRDAARIGEEYFRPNLKFKIADWQAAIAKAREGGAMDE